MIKLPEVCTKEILESLFIKRIHELRPDDSSNNSIPKPLFNKDGSFNIDNWNSGQDVIRFLLMNKDIDSGSSGIYEYDGSEEKQYVDLMIQYVNFNDDSYFTIFFTRSGEILPYYTYMINWYKSRGRTAGIFKNGHFININEYIELYNLMIQYMNKDGLNEIIRR